jgi:hypothetical protein
LRDEMARARRGKPLLSKAFAVLGSVIRRGG